MKNMYPAYTFLTFFTLALLISSCLPPPDLGGPGPIPVSGTGTGLMGSYFDSQSFFVGSRVDSVIDFYWGYGSPLNGVPDDNFSVVWIGMIEFPVDGAYTFVVNSDDGVRLFIDDSDDLFGGGAWVDQGMDVEHSVTKSFSVGKKNIRIEYYEKEWNSGIKLSWVRPDGVSEVVPMIYLYPGSTVSNAPSDLPFDGIIQPPPSALCGNNIIESGEECDDGNDNGKACVPPTGGSCTYCDNNCKTVTLYGDTSPSSDIAIVSYEIDNTGDFMNPERGWMIREPHTTSAFMNARNGDNDNLVGYTVVWSYMTGTPWTGSSGNPFRLDNYRTSDIPTSLLTELNNVFEAARKAGVKMKIRFAYNYDSTGQDTRLEWIKKHIIQLSPTINANKDVIVGMDAGLVGRWGEWNYQRDTVGNLVLDLPGGSGNTRWWTEPYLTAYAEVYNTLLSSIDKDIMIMMRAPRGDRGYRLYFDGRSSSRPLWSNFNPNDRFSGSDQSRIGWYIDCLYTNQDYAGTFDFDGNKGEIDRQAAALMGRYAVTSGETCKIGGLNSYNDGATVISEMEYLGGPDHLFRKYWVDVYNKWKDSGHYDEISRRLGYRLSLINATLPTKAEKSELITLNFAIENSGFGKVYNQRPIELVLINPSNNRRIILENDARKSLPLAGEKKILTYTIRIPNDMPTGTYQLYLGLSDASSRLRNDPRYSIRLANNNMWDSSNGLNNLSASIQIV